jgi:hypothetical protein
MGEPDRLGPLLRLFIGLKVNKVWPYAANLIIYGPRKGRARWKECERDAPDTRL